jgi:hypothetical protein
MDSFILISKGLQRYGFHEPLRGGYNTLIRGRCILDELLGGSSFNRFFDAGIGAAAANITHHGSVDFFVAGMRIGFEQRGGRHNLPGLAVATLRHINFEPGFLQGVIAVFRKPFDGGNGAVAYGRDGQYAGACGGFAEVNGAGAALCHAAAELGPHQLQVVAQYPKEWGSGVNVHFTPLAVDF